MGIRRGDGARKRPNYIYMVAHFAYNNNIKIDAGGCDAMWIALAALIVLGSVWIALILPGRSQRAQRAPFIGRAYAHRGLYEEDQSVPENSAEAFHRAAEAGYGVELDVQLTKDKVVVVFHDGSLARACGVDARVDSLTFAELQQLRLFGTEHRVPRLTDALYELGGRVPVIVELKAGGDWRQLCELTLGHLNAYRGAACVESFHPLLVRWYYKNAPRILRGQLSEAYRYSSRSAPWYVSLFMSRLLTNAFTRPQFIAYRIGAKCLSARLCERLGAMRVCWTAHAEDDHAALMRKNDAVIFEHYRPAPRG